MQSIVFKIEFKTNLKFYFVSYNAKNNILSLLDRLLKYYLLAILLN